MSLVPIVQAKLIHGTKDHGRIEWQCPYCAQIQQESIDEIYGPSIDLICENCAMTNEFEVRE